MITSTSQQFNETASLARCTATNRLQLMRSGKQQIIQLVKGMNTLLSVSCCNLLAHLPCSYSTTPSRARCTLSPSASSTAPYANGLACIIVNTCLRCRQTAGVHRLLYKLSTPQALPPHKLAHTGRLLGSCLLGCFTCRPPPGKLIKRDETVLVCVHHLHCCICLIPADILGQ